MKKWVFSGGVTRNFLLSYLMILLIPMGFFISSNNSAVNTIKESAASYHLSMLDQARNALENQITETRRMAMQIAQDQTINDYMYSLEHKTASAYQIWQVQKTLGSYLSTNQYISQIYLCAQENHTVISTSYYHKSTVQSSSMTINGSGNLVLSPLFQYSLGALEPVTLADDKIKESTMMFLRSFPDGVVDASYGNICIVFDEDQLKKLLSFSNQWTGGFNIILDENNRILAADGKSPERISDVLMSFEGTTGNMEIRLGNEDMFVTFLKSAPYGWTYLSVYPQKQVLAKTIHTRRILLFSMIAAAVIGLTAAAMLSMRSAKPVRKIMASLNKIPTSQRSPDKNEYNVIQSAVDQLVAENRDLAVHSDDQKQMVKEAFFHILMNSRLADSNLVLQISQELGVDIERCAFIGIQFAFEQNLSEDNAPYPKKSPLSDLVWQLFTEHFGAERCAFFSGSDSHLILLCFLAEQRLEIYSKIQTLTQEISLETADSDHSIRLFLGISNVYTIAQDIGKCSEEAQFSLEYSKLFEFGRPVFYDTIQANITECKFTLSDHQRLLNILKSGSIGAAQTVFNDLVQNKIIENKINVLTGEQLFYAIKGLLIEGMDFIDDNKLREKIQSMQFSETEVFNSFLSLEELYLAVTAEIGRKKENKGSKLIGDILDYLKKEFADPGISITSVAAQFNISEAYLSKLFREVMQITFASWLEKFRLEKAKLLLADGHSTMVEIAPKTGYNSVESFRRAFKRAMGVAPSDYQEFLRKNK